MVEVKTSQVAMQPGNESQRINTFFSRTHSSIGLFHMTSFESGGGKTQAKLLCNQAMSQQINTDTLVHRNE